MRSWRRPILNATLPLAIVSGCFAQSAAPIPISSPGGLVRAVVLNELKPQANQPRWMYETNIEEGRKIQSKQVIQTREGSFERLVATNGQALSLVEQREEEARIESVVNRPQERKKLTASQKKDEEECEAFFRTIPDAFLFTFLAKEGNLVKLSFRPNPNFQPVSREARVLHAMEGELFVQEKELRLAAIRGHLIDDVKFGGGLLGYLEKGGEFSVTRTELSPDLWVLTAMEVNMKGKALFLKTISVQRKEHRSDFRKLTNDPTLTEAANLLTSHVTVATKQ